MADKGLFKLDDDQLEDVSGGQITINNTIHMKGEGSGVQKTIKDESMEANVRVLGGMTKSGQGHNTQKDIAQRNNDKSIHSC